MTHEHRSIAHIRWPAQCPACGSVATRSLAVDSSSVKRLMPGIFSAVSVESEVTRIRHPVCADHYAKSWLAGGLSQRGLGNLALGVLTLFAVLFMAAAAYRLIAHADPMPPLAVALAGAYIVLYWSAFVWARRHTLVRIGAVEPLAITFVINNDKYAAAFAEHNRCSVDGTGAPVAVTVQFIDAKKEMNRVAEQGDLACQAQLPRSSNPYLATGDALLASYWDRGYDVAQKRGRNQDGAR